MNITIEQVAKQAGVTPGTVSRALKGEGASTLSRATQLRVATIANQMGYEPNTSARMLATGKTNQVAAIYVNPPYGPDKLGHAVLLETLAEELGSYGYDLKIKAFRNNAELLTALPTLSKSRSCDAMVLWGFNDDVNTQGELLESIGFPFVARGRHEETHPNWIQADFDHEGMMSNAVDKLVGLGHRRIAYLGHVPWYTFSEHLFEGYISAMAAHDLETDDAWHLLQDDTTAEGAFNVLKKLQAWPQLPPSGRPTAVACGAPAVWPVFQKTLIRQGYTFGDRDGGITLAGVLANAPMIVGSAWSFQTTTGDDLVRAMVELQLMPLLEGRSPQRVLRRIPPLERMEATFKSRDEMKESLQLPSRGSNQ